MSNNMPETMPEQQSVVKSATKVRQYYEENKKRGYNSK